MAANLAIDPFSPECGEVRKLLAELPGGCPKPAVYSRWILTGRLRAVKFRNKWYTSRDEIRRFFLLNAGPAEKTDGAIQRQLIERGYARA